MRVLLRASVLDAASKCVLQLWTEAQEMSDAASMLLGIVARSRVNTPESGLPPVVAEFVADEAQGELELSTEPVVVWTTVRARARQMPWDVAEVLAKRLGWPVHAITVSREAEGGIAQSHHSTRTLHVDRSCSVAPEEVFARLERRHLA
jgi:hypothetical protein